MYPKKILIIYTGGTIGMIRTERQPYLTPAGFNELRRQIPEIDRLACEMEFYAFETPIDSSSMSPEIWQELAGVIWNNYAEFDGFVILHGTDTMAHTASALSFMFENLTKPIILTGSQLPIDVIRTDARENLVTAIEIASNPDYTLPEVGVYFDTRLLRGNRSLKHSADRFSAFISPNYPALAEVGVNLTYYTEFWRPYPLGEPKVDTRLDSNVGLLKFYPGIPQLLVETVLSLPTLRGVVLETYGTGNLPDFPWFIRLLTQRIQEGLVVLNVTQCTAGRVKQETYKNSRKLLDVGVVSGRDMTTAAALAKFMSLQGKYTDSETIKRLLGEDLRGELSMRN